MCSPVLAPFASLGCALCWCPRHPSRPTTKQRAPTILLSDNQAPLNQTPSKQRTTYGVIQGTSMSFRLSRQIFLQAQTSVFRLSRRCNLFSCAVKFSEARDCDCLQLLDVPPVVYTGCWAVAWIRILVVAFEAVRSGHNGVCFRSSGGNSWSIGGRTLLGTYSLRLLGSSSPRSTAEKKYLATAQETENSSAWNHIYNLQRQGSV